MELHNIYSHKMAINMHYIHERKIVLTSHSKEKNRKKNSKKKNSKKIQSQNRKKKKKKKFEKKIEEKKNLKKKISKKNRSATFQFLCHFPKFSKKNL